MLCKKFKGVNEIATEKYLVRNNPFVEGGKTILKVVRETKTTYVVKYNNVAEGKFRKPPVEKNGAFVDSIPKDKWDKPYTLMIKEGV